MGTRTVAGGTKRYTSMFGKRRSHLLTGVILLAASVLISVVSFVSSNPAPFIALGIACAILGLITLTLPDELKTAPAMNVLLSSAVLAIDSSLQGLSEAKTNGAPSAIYLPPGPDGIVYAYLPLGSSVADIGKMQSAPTKLGGSESGVRVVPIGAEVTHIPEISESQDDAPISLTEGLENVLVDSSDLCSSVNVIEVGEDLILELSGLKVRLDVAKNYSKYLGSIQASLAACVVAYSRKRPVVILSESLVRNNLFVRLKFWSAS
jgi:hypothetical protein